MEKEIKNIIKEKYKEIATENCGCCCSSKNNEDVSKKIGYSDNDINF